MPPARSGGSAHGAIGVVMRCLERRDIDRAAEALGGIAGQFRRKAGPARAEHDFLFKGVPFKRQVAQDTVVIETHFGEARGIAHLAFDTHNLEGGPAARGRFNADFRRRRHIVRFSFFIHPGFWLLRQQAADAEHHRYHRCHRHHPHQPIDEVGQTIARQHCERRIAQGLLAVTQQRQQGQRDQTLAAHARKINQLQRKAVLGHDARFHAAGRAQPVHSPAARTQFFGHGKAWEDVATGATGHDQSGFLNAHTRPPLMRSLFS